MIVRGNLRRTKTQGIVSTTHYNPPSLVKLFFSMFITLHNGVMNVKRMDTLLTRSSPLTYFFKDY